jgi:transcription antitermination factor NusG
MLAEKNWYAINLKEQWEKKVIDSLSRKKITTYFPLNKIRKQQDDNNSSLIYRPLFPRLLFVHITEMEIIAVKQTEGVLHFLYWLGDYAFISEGDIDAIRFFLNIYHDVWLEKAPVTAETKIIVQPNKGFDIKSYIVNTSIEKILLPTLGYFLLATAEKTKEVLLHAI